MKHQAKHWYQIGAERVNALSLRERMLVFVTIMILVYSAWDRLFFNMAFGSEEKIAKNASSLKSQIIGLKSQIGTLSESIRTDPFNELIDRVKQLERETGQLEQGILTLAKQLNPPKEMAKLLSTVLEQHGDVSVVRLENLPEKALFTEPVNKSEANTDDPPAPITPDRLQVYKHGLEIELRGTYANTQNFLKALESSSWKLLWDSFSYTVETYPLANVVLVINTLSMNEGWIGA